MAQNFRFAMGIQLMALLAAEPETARTSSEVAKLLHRNPVIVRRALLSLRKAGLVSGHKGPGGGAKLTRPAKQISLAEIYQAVEAGELFHLPHGATDEDAGIRAAMGGVFKRANKALLEELQDVALSQVLKKARK